MKRVAGLIFFLFSVSANASLIGDEVDCLTSTSSWACDTSTAVVSDSSVEFGLMVHTSIRAFDVDIGADSLYFDVLGGVGNIWGLGPVSLLNFDSVINGYTFDTNIAGLDASRLWFTSDSFYVNFDGLTTQAGQYLSISLQTTPVPEPAVVSLLAIGLVGMGLSKRKKNT